MEAKKSPRNDLIHVYLLNVREIYDQYFVEARSVSKRMERGLIPEEEELAKSPAVDSLQVKLNLYSQKYDGIRCAEDGDRVLIAREIIEEAQEIALGN